MKNHPRYQNTLEDLFLKVYVLVDDWLKANEERFALPQQSSQVASYSELFTIALVGELLSQPHESVWYWLVGQCYRELFPRLPEYSRYHRVVRNAERLWAELAQSLATQEDWGIEVIDTKPLPIAKGKRWEWTKMSEASKGFSTLGIVWGFKLHAVVSLGGLFRRWAFVPAHWSLRARVNLKIAAHNLIHSGVLA